jgi:hypothetical protein
VVGHLLDRGGILSRASYGATVDDAAYGTASPVTPKFISPSDPAAQWTGAMKSAAFFAYADNYLIDVKFGIIMDVEASRAIRQAEVGASRTMIERTEATFGIKPEWLAGDTAYGSAPRRRERRRSIASSSSLEAFSAATFSALSCRRMASISAQTLNVSWSNSGLRRSQLDVPPEPCAPPHSPPSDQR